jgi:hypothetical protein
VQAIDSYGDGTTMRKNFIRDASILVASNMRVRKSLIGMASTLVGAGDENEYETQS